MATRRNYLYFGSEKFSPVNNEFELDESDVWDLAHVASNEPKRPFSSARAAKKFVKRNDHGSDHGSSDVASTSLPVNVVDWSRVLRGKFTSRKVEFEEEDENENENEMVPPHEYLARTRVASCSVHEGFGRTLKGRDMRMVRNAVWKHTGFED